jgi:8-hydroxy-5-deazaflavin:NADPH oxidoreductase
MRIGIVGAGFSGRGPARLAVRHGYDVMLSNSRDPASLPATMLICRVGTNSEVAEFGEVVLIAVPFAKHKHIAPEPLAGKIVVDATDYDPKRDGQIAELDNGTMTGSELLAAHFRDADVVKALNVIKEQDLEKDGRPSGAPCRRALPIAGDADHAKELVASLLDRIGFDVVDAGPLSEGWRFEPGQPAYGVPLDTAGLQDALATAIIPSSSAVKLLAVD